MRLISSIICFFFAIQMQAQPNEATKATTVSNPKVLIDKVIGIVGDRCILKSDLINLEDDYKRQGMELPPNATCIFFEQMLTNMALMLQAEKDSIKVTEEEVQSDIDSRIGQLMSQYKTVEELEAAAGKSIFQMKNEFKNPIRDKMLADE